MILPSDGFGGLSYNSLGSRLGLGCGGLSRCRLGGNHFGGGFGCCGLSGQFGLSCFGWRDGGGSLGRGSLGRRRRRFRSGRWLGGCLSGCGLSCGD
jgi:hypothetical protein